MYLTGSFQLISNFVVQKTSKRHKIKSIPTSSHFYDSLLTHISTKLQQFLITRVSASSVSREETHTDAWQTSLKQHLLHQHGWQRVTNESTNFISKHKQMHFTFCLSADFMHIMTAVYRYLYRYIHQYLPAIWGWQAHSRNFLSRHGTETAWMPRWTAYLQCHQ